MPSLRYFPKTRGSKEQMRENVETIYFAIAGKTSSVPWICSCCMGTFIIALLPNLTVLFSFVSRTKEEKSGFFSVVLHQKQRSPLRAERPHTSFEMQMARADRPSPVWSTLTPVAEMSLFERRFVMCVGRQGRLVMIALLWLSASENKVFILCQGRSLLSLISPMRPPSPPPPPHHLHPLNLLSWFGITVQRHGLLVQPVTITAHEERCSSHSCFHVATRLLLYDSVFCRFVCSHVASSNMTVRRRWEEARAEIWGGSAQVHVGSFNYTIKIHETLNLTC